MNHKPIHYLENILSVINSNYIKNIRADNNKAFTRKRKVDLKQLFLQMFNNNDC